MFLACGVFGRVRLLWKVPARTLQGLVGFPAADYVNWNSYGYVRTDDPYFLKSPRQRLYEDKLRLSGRLGLGRVQFPAIR